MSTDPVIYDENDRLRLELPAPPNDLDFYPVTGAVLQGFVDQVNELRDERDRLRLVAGQAVMLVTARALRFVRDDAETRTILARWRQAIEPSAPCCDLHNTHCEPPADLCCRWCTEADHPHHFDGVPCVLTPELHPTRRDLDKLEGP